MTLNAEGVGGRSTRSGTTRAVAEAFQRSDVDVGGREHRCTAHLSSHLGILNGHILGVTLDGDNLAAQAVVLVAQNAVLGTQAVNLFLIVRAFGLQFCKSLIDGPLGLSHIVLGVGSGLFGCGLSVAGFLVGLVHEGNLVGKLLLQTGNLGLLGRHLTLQQGNLCGSFGIDSIGIVGTLT